MCCKCVGYKKHDNKKLPATPQAAFALGLSVGTLQAVPCVCVGGFYSFGSKKNIYFLPLLFFIRWGGTVQYRFVNLPSD